MRFGKINCTRSYIEWYQKRAAPKTPTKWFLEPCSGVSIVHLRKSDDSKTIIVSR